MKRLLIVAGAIIVCLALLAPQIGLDNDAGWGRGRIALLSLGVALLIVGAILHHFGDSLTRSWGGVTTSIERLIDRNGRIILASVAALVLVLTAYLWFIRLGERDALKSYDYYVELTYGFKNGHLYLEQTPTDRLLSLGNPYDFYLRKEKNIEDFPWDVSLYKGRFYIYWGPVPAILIMVFDRARLAQIGDFHLALAFACGLFLYMTLLVSTIWQKFYKNAPVWLLWFLLIVIGFATPTTIMMYKSEIYDAAIFGCQFFFIGGCYWAFRSMLNGKLKIGLLAASVHWALAVGTRVIILPAVVFAAGLTLAFIYRSFSLRTIKELMPSFIAIALPLMMAGIGLAYYNYARFEDIFEFGITYQLANVDYTNFHGSFSFSFYRIYENLKLYFLYPIEIRSRFPYLNMEEYIVSNARMAGLLYVSPFIVLVFPIIRLLKGIGKEIVYDPLENWLYLMLAGSGLISFFLLMSFYFVAMRYNQDFMPAFLGSIAIQIGMGYELLEKKPLLRNGLIFVVVLLGIITIVANFLLAVPDSGVLFAVNLLNAISKLLGLR